ncbi:MAG: thioredoxin family protein [candidate division WOR-3 bacterium]
MLLKERDRQIVTERLSHLPNPVQLILFTDMQSHKESSEIMRQLLEEVVAASQGNVSLKVYELADSPQEAQSYGLERAPALVVRSAQKDYGIRFLGVPAGYEFASLMGAIEDVGNGEPNLSPDTRLQLATLKRPVHLQVFVTFGCPYCPAAVRLAHKLAMASDLVRAEMVSSEEFPELASRYGVMAVPKTVINGQYGFEGALPEPQFVQQVLRAASGGLLIVP